MQDFLMLKQVCLYIYVCVCVCVFDVMCHSLLSDELFFINFHCCYYFHYKFCSEYNGHMTVLNVFATAKPNLPYFCKNYHTQDPKIITTTCSTYTNIP